MISKSLIHAALAVLVGFSLAAGIILIGRAASLPPEIPWRVFSGGGAPASSTSFRLESSLGKMAPGTAASANHDLGGGYWYAARLVDLSLNKNAFPDPVQAGDSLTYTLQISSQSAFTATGLLLEDQLPSGAGFLSASHGDCSHESGLVTCKLGDLAPNGSLEVQIVTTVSLSAPSTLTNQASVYAAHLDPDLLSNQAETNTQVQGVTVFIYLPLVIK